MTQALWNAYLARARQMYEEIETAERYKSALGKALTRAREALLRDDRDWSKLVVKAVQHKDNINIHWRNQAKLVKWIRDNAAQAREALSAIWSEHDRTPADRVRVFDDRLPASVFSRGSESARLDAASYLMMGIDVQRYPPYRRDAFRNMYGSLGYPPSSASDAGGEYEHALAFLDRMLEEARRQGMDWPDTRLDAQSVVWWLKDRDSPPPRPDPDPPAPRDHAEPIRSVHALNTILYGPPGTGKTWHTVTRAVAIVENREADDVAQEERGTVKRRFDEHRGAGRIEMVTFHQNTTYEDFVEGIRPVLTGGTSAGGETPAEDGAAGEVRYELSRGVFPRMAERAGADPNGRYVLVIDEINRGNVARIFGELITLIEDSKRLGRDDEARVRLPGSKTDFGVPNNLHVIGTMNTADRSIALLDTALRRRFVFEEMMPEPFHADIRKDVDGIDCQRLLDAMNRRIAVLLDREHQIGHTYLLGVEKLEVLANTFRTRIVPLLQEYFYDDWEKIRAVLNQNAFVRKLDPPAELVRWDLVDADQAVYELLPAQDARWTAQGEYRKIYEGTTQTEDDGVARGD